MFFYVLFESHTIKSTDIHWKRGLFILKRHKEMFFSKQRIRIDSQAAKQCQTDSGQ